jgi:acetyltransferase-like isoleucine patch superfamily enzyme
MNLIVAALRRYAMSFGMAILPFSCTRVLLLRLCGVNIGEGCYVGFHVMCDTNYAEKITIGDNVTISHGTQIYTHTRTPAKSFLASLYREVQTVHIDDGAWIGAECLILPGARIGRDCLVGAGSVVAKSTEPCSVYAGNPCRKIKSLPLP